MCGNPFVMGKIASPAITETSILATPSEFFDRETFAGREGAYGGCGQLKTGIMNYSPKSSGRGSSMNVNRNMKNLSLNLGKSGNFHYERDSGSADPNSQEMGMRNRKNLALTIQASESNHGEQSPSLKTPAVSRTPTLPPLMPSQRAHRNSPSRDNHLPIAVQKYPTTHKETARKHQNDLHTSSNDLRSPFILNGDEKLISSFKNLAVPERSKVPEELQEFSSLEAYPYGPANVLNDSIYLYSEPSCGKSKVDINDYDLVINVARECEDRSASFDTRGGTREYLYVPWAHNSNISHELPEVTRKIEQYDDSNKDTNSKRKVLVHCQCGVSRSACVIVAYYMYKFKLGVNQAYELLKSGTSNQKEQINQLISSKGYSINACTRICPNMNLIFELMEFNDKLDKDNQSPAC